MCSAESPLLLQAGLRNQAAPDSPARGTRPPAINPPTPPTHPLHGSAGRPACCASPHPSSPSALRQSPVSQGRGSREGSASRWGEGAAARAPRGVSPGTSGSTGTQSARCAAPSPHLESVLGTRVLALVGMHHEGDLHRKKMRACIVRFSQGRYRAGREPGTPGKPARSTVQTRLPAVAVAAGTEESAAAAAAGNLCDAPCGTAAALPPAWHRCAAPAARAGCRQEGGMYVNSRHPWTFPYQGQAA